MRIGGDVSVWSKIKEFHTPVVITVAIAAILTLLVYCFRYWQEANERSNSQSAVLQETEYAPQVLFISSYHDTLETVDLERRGLVKVFAQKKIRMDIEYMDTKHYATEESIELFHDLLKYKIEHHSPYKAIILGDDQALAFGERYQKELFDGIPMVFFCVNNLEHAEKAVENPLITGAWENVQLEDTIAFARTVLPNAKYITAVVDNTPTGIGNQAECEKAAVLYPDLEFSMINASELTRRQLAERIEHLPQDTIILYMDATDDVSGRRYLIGEGTRLIVRNTSNPVFRPFAGGIGDGLLGGKVVDYEASGEWTANTVTAIIRGVDPNSIPLNFGIGGKYIVDYNVMKKFNIPESILPDGTEIINKEISFWVQNRAILIPMVAIVAILLVILFLTRRSYRRMVKISRRLKDTIETLDFQTTHDTLTHLPNRQAAVLEFERRIRRRVDFTAFVVDMDNFKKINDFYSHSVGNEMLCILARRIRERFLRMNRGSYAARIGGDEFVLMLPGILTEKDGETIEQLAKIFNEPIHYEDKTVPLEASIGVIPSNEEKINSADLMLANADVALLDAKKNSKGNCVFYRAESKRSLQRINEIEEILRDAVEREAFQVLYQPQVNAATQKLHGFEALARLSDAKIYPGEFIPVAESTGLIMQIGRIITKKILKQMADWREAGKKLHRVAINYSCGQLADAGYAKYLADLMDEYSIPSDLVEIEVTESLFLGNNKQAHDLFLAFAAKGVKMALDDFGTGYSSLSYLTYLPVDVVKIDKSLMDTYLQDEMGTFMENLVKLIHSLNMKIVVEGVEHMVQFEKLRNYKVDIIQGYYFSRPIPANEAIVFDPSHPKDVG